MLFTLNFILLFVYYISVKEIKLNYTPLYFSSYLAFIFFISHYHVYFVIFFHFQSLLLECKLHDDMDSVQFLGR